MLVDNTMTGELRELIDYYRDRDPRISTGSPAAQGIPHACNTGVEQALGTYVAFLDDDEEACAGWVAALLQRHPGACSIWPGSCEL